MRSEKAQAERRAREGFRIAHRDALTGLPNRYSLDKALLQLPMHGSLTFIDLDGLKHYNDKYGHRKGDELLCSLAEAVAKRLGERAALYRLSGDEFAVTCSSGDVEFVAGKIDEAISGLRHERFTIAGASFGSVHRRPALRPPAPVAERAGPTSLGLSRWGRGSLYCAGV